jgi:Tol biopolymer transport system component
MNLQGADRLRITAGTGTGVTAPKVSPDGTMLSFVDYDAAGHGALFTAKIDGSKLHQLTPFALAIQTKVDWAPDGQHLEFSRDDSLPPPGLSPNIISIRLDGTQLHFLTHYSGGGAVNAGGGTYSPDGAWIAFWFTDSGQYGLYKMRPDGSNVQAILPLSGMRPFNIDWGPAPQS